MSSIILNERPPIHVAIGLAKCTDKSPFIDAELGGYDEFNKLRKFGHFHLYDTFKSVYGVLFAASSYQIIGKAIYLVGEYD